MIIKLILLHLIDLLAINEINCQQIIIIKLIESTLNDSPTKNIHQQMIIIKLIDSTFNDLLTKNVD